jgi:phosphatidylserine/phosphatidylglycerophosphate/cardiolipin synthase-like enzyme
VRRFLTGKTAWRVHERVRSGLLIDADDYYRAFYVAASQAKRSILILGWQFDSDVQLLRGDDLPEGSDPRDYQLIAVLDRLCRERPELEVKMLAWDHSVIFSLEREVLQKIVFDITTVARLQFQTDGTVPLGGSHHQKVAIIDGQVAFMGSADICQDRWDTSAHVSQDPRRISRNDVAHKPYHEVQAVFGGVAARLFVDLFAQRWEHATGTKLDTDRLIAPDDHDDLFARIPVTLPMPAAPVGFSRTVPAGEDRHHVHEIRDLYVRAIQRAERMIYIETQYVTSSCVRDALVSRMKDTTRPKLDIVMVLPQKPEKLKEEVFIGGTQADVVSDIVAASLETGHSLGIYDVAVPNGSGVDSTFVYIHAKLMIIDDVFFTMGSANLANRSMTVDSEINATWVAQAGDHELHAAIRRARVRLLLEHLGDVPNGVRIAAGRRGLVARLDRVAREGKGRLRPYDLRHEMPSVLAKAMSDLANDYVDPTDGTEPLPPPSTSVW